ncbi:hypothetical protein [Streptomyces sp. NPDC006610]|jgi:hypothetical protein|uniref:hypothetical protein n=1 Tax=Streptomyces sp. NPDC006610 TaxID=3154584 RepID=UPI0033AD14EE
MKPLQAAAVVAGSLVVAGAAAPAFAAPAGPTPPTSVTGAVKTITSEPVDVMPLRQETHALDTEKEGSVLHTANSTTESLNRARLLGGMPVR